MLCPLADAGFPFVSTYGAFPVHSFRTSRDNAQKVDIFVFLGIPFSCQLGEKGWQIVISDQDSFVCAKRALFALPPLIDRFLPSVPVFTFPPGFFVASLRQLFGEKLQFGIFFKVPFGQEFFGF